MVKTIIDDVLNQMILDKEVFTANDVTLAVRKLTINDVPYEDVKNIIINKFVTGQMLDYNRDYKFEGMDFVAVYRPEVSSNTTEETPTEEITVEDTPAVETTTIDSGVVVKLTKDGRVNIPKELLKQVTEVDGSYDIYINDTHKCVSPNKNGCIRFGLRSFGIKGDKVSLVVNTNSIRISEVS